MTGTIVSECIHGMTSAWCSLCKAKHPREAQREARNARQWQSYDDDVPRIDPALGPHTTAQFESECPWCDESICPGDQIGLRDGEWICVECCDRYDHPSNYGG